MGQERTGRLLAVGVGTKRRAMDDIFAKRMWRTVKCEDVYLKEYSSPKEAWHGLAGYRAFYNDIRLHASLAYHGPAEIHYQKGEDSIWFPPPSVR
jgi:putative transposase